MKGYKVTSRNRTKIVGIACNSLQQLIQKGRQKLEMKEKIVVALDDGTIVDDEDYFQALPAQTVFIFHKENEEVFTGVDYILNVLRKVNTSYIDLGFKAEEFVKSKANELMEILKKTDAEESNKITKNTPLEDPEWFSDLETNAGTKDEYMYRKSQNRIRGYLYKFQEGIRKSKYFIHDPEFRRISLNCLSYFKSRLCRDDYFGCYFDRRYAKSTIIFKENKSQMCESPQKKLKSREDIDEDGESWTNYDKSSYCDNNGTFVCQGKWKLENCEFVNRHKINPYLSKEARILFSTWNLDHRIERSRSVAPSFFNAVKSCSRSQSINFLYFYQLLFTKMNLKFVHVACHDKAVHDIYCDSSLIYL